jgi:hypothetical protein
VDILIWPKLEDYLSRVLHEKEGACHATGEKWLQALLAALREAFTITEENNSKLS